MSLLAVQDEITAKLRELSQDVYETAAPDDSKLKFDPTGIILPYIVIEFSDTYASQAGVGIVSTRYDLKSSYVLVSCVGPTERSVRQVAELVRDKLTGFTPSRCTELTQAMGGVTYTTVDAKPNRFVSELGFSFLIDPV